MKKYIFSVLIVLAAVSCKAQNIDQMIEENQTLDSNKVIQPTEKYTKLNQVITQVLKRFHYRKMALNDSVSNMVYNNLVNSLDHNKLYFLKSDIEEFDNYKNQYDDYLRIGNVHPAYDIFNRFKKRLDERVRYANERMKTEFDFSLDEQFTANRKDADWASTVDELNEIWRKRLKNDALNLKLKGKEWKDIEKTLLARYHRFQKAILQYKSEDVFQLYMNAFAEVADPHTSYFSPITMDNFNINMKLSLEGIGAQLTSEEDYTQIARIIPGGPADKSGLLHEDDRIVGVAQGNEGEMVDVIGWRLDDVVQLIRGKKGSTVRLSVLRAGDTPDMPTEEIKLIRDEVKLEDQAATSKVIDIMEDGVAFKLGVIDLPSFYTNFQKRHLGWGNYKSTSYDVAMLVNELKEQNVDGIVMDLRNNGGGSLLEAVELTGLFIEDGPVVQVKSSMGKVEVNEDTDERVFYDGPLAVMVNSFSASASEIFSAAIQDYQRGVIVGEQTYGKGTVQNLINLKSFIPSAREKLGQLKLTVAKFYRITGGSTQHKGVVPDIEFPSFYEHEEYGESSKPTALPWDQILAANYHKYYDLSQIIESLRLKHEERIKNNLEFDYRLEDIAEYRKNREKKEFSLNEEFRKRERDKNKAKNDARDAERQSKNEIQLTGSDEVKKKSLKVDDPLLEETGHILADLAFLTKEKLAKVEQK